MKRIGTELCVVICIGIVLISLSVALPVFADITYSDGGIHNISASMPVGTINVTSGTTLNVLSGGSLTTAANNPSSIINASYSSPVNIYGGTTTGNFGISSWSSPLNIYGGTITSGFGITANNGSAVNIYGGTITNYPGDTGGYGISASSSLVNIVV